MDQNERNLGINSEYEELHNTVVSDHLNPFRIVIPSFVIILIIAIMCIYTYIQKISIIEDTEQVTNQIAEYIAGSISNEMDFAKSSIKLASLTITESMTSEELEDPAAIIIPMIANTPFGGIEYIRADGMNVMTIGEPFDASDRTYYIEGIKGNTGVWNNYHPKTAKETLMNFYTPIFYHEKITGVLTGYIAATSQLTPLFESQLYGQDVYGLLVDENEMVICSTIESEYIQDLTLEDFMEHFGVTSDQKMGIYNAIDNASLIAAAYKDPGGDGRVSVATIPGTDWKVVILVPEKSFHAIINKNTKDSIITILSISLIFISYAAFVLFKNMKRRKEIAIENEKLEEENRAFNKENKRAFKEISAIRDIIASANMGTWRIELVDGKEPCMYVDLTMRELLGVTDKGKTPQETYKEWFDNIVPEAVPSVLESVKRMEEGSFDENTYLWKHPTKGERYVRCGGTAQKIYGGYLLSGYHYDVDDVVREDQAKRAMLEAALNEKNDFYNTLGKLAGIYNSLHVLDLVQNTFIEFSASDQIKEIADSNNNAVKTMADVMSRLVTDEYVDRALEYTDLTTIADRMQNKKFVSIQLKGRNIGWFLANFITMDTDDDGRPTKVIFTTQSIDETKKQEEQLIRKSHTDELTGLLNRRAYEEDVYEHDSIPDKDHFVLMSLDVNGLKTINDTLGHAAGDELIIGAGWCMKKCFGSYGKIYRTGGDEFTVVLFCDDEKLKEVLADFEDTMANWKGKMCDSLSISYGYISKEEEPRLSVRELGTVADKRMYEAKSAHYRKKGIDRRGHKDAHRALCELYTKILKINITDDTYQIVNMDVSEMTTEKGFADRISLWLLLFGASGQVHPEDLQEYLNKTDTKFLKEYFDGNNTLLRFVYRRKYGDDYKHVMMEIIPANDYSQTNQSLYLYVKCIDQ